MRDILTAGLAEMGVTAPPGALERLEEYAALLLEKNQVMNLTAITQPRDVARLHFLDSAAVLAYGGQRREGGSWLAGKSVIDVGTGAGFPGLVLKILEPSLRLTLLDSLGKRVDWLGEVCKALSLDGVDCLHARAEEQANISSFRDSFDVAVSRAVAALPALTELCLPFVRPGGVFLAMKSVGSDVEIAQAQNAVKRLGARGWRSSTTPFPAQGRTTGWCAFPRRGALPRAIPGGGRPSKRAPCEGKMCFWAICLTGNLSRQKFCR